MTKMFQTEFNDTVRRDASLFGVTLSADEISLLTSYYELLLHWNPRLHLVAPCSASEFARRHILESLLVLPYLKTGARVVDVGSGGGLPIIPCLLLRNDISASLIEASPRKAVFLREALNTLHLEDRATVIADRFERLPPPKVDAITCRALERFEAMLPRLIEWAPPNCCLLLFAGNSVLSALKAAALPFESVLVPTSDRRYLINLKRASDPINTP
jgi:16S rRNA (guanine527-N7)-methyltransferase